MKIFQTSQIRNIDRLTTEREKISSFQLMERASKAFFEELIKHIQRNDSIAIIAGYGNNGGDALVIARYLIQIGLKCTIYFYSATEHISADCQSAYDTLVNLHPIKKIFSAEDIDLSDTTIIIDGLFGSGLNRSLDSNAQEIVDKINKSKCNVFSIDIPSGLFGEDNSSNDHEHIVNANFSFSFQMPKACFFFAENEKHIGIWKVLDIGLNKLALEETETPFYLTEESEIAKMIHPRGKFSHKGTFGHALLISGSYGMMGASVLATKAALRTGCGLVTAHIPQKGYEIMQISVPEAIVSLDKSEKRFTESPNLSKYNAIGIGPGLGTADETLNAFHRLLEANKQPMVIDADALNLLAKDLTWWDKIPHGSILTPHPKEFERISGEQTKGYNSWMKQIALSKQYNVIIVLKGAYSTISLPDGTLHINPTGNPGMATAGSGDVLTGMITSLLAQGYTPEESAILGVWLHGKAGDLATEKRTEAGIIASDIVEMINVKS